MIDNYEQVREAIARFMGWQWNPDVELWATPNGEVWQAPDPINYSGDAWALQCAIEEKGVLSKNWHDPNDGNFYRRLTNVDIGIVRESGKTPAEALVNAWVAAFGGEAEHVSK